MATSAEIRQELVDVNGPTSGEQRGRPANTSDSADTEQIGLAP